MILVIDNYDSFTYNLVQYLGELGATVKVVRNDQMTLDEIEEMKPERIVISPGPGDPDDGGISNDVIRDFGPRYPSSASVWGTNALGRSTAARSRARRA